MPTATTRPPDDRPVPASLPGRARLVLTIAVVPYAVRPLPAAEMPAGAVRAFRLTRADRHLGRVSHVVAETITGPSCSCGDATFRQTPRGGICKHVAACEAVGLF